jgi:hypothetical protein
MRIPVKQESVSGITLDLSPADRVEDVKRMIADQVKTPVEDHVAI